VDGETFADFGHVDRFSRIRGISRSLRDGTWTPAPLRRVLIPKPAGRGSRPLDIPTVEDRAVETALYLALLPILDPLMTDRSFGFRPGRSTQHGLATTIWHAQHEGLTTGIPIDLRKAFTAVPKRRLVGLLRQMVPNPQVNDLLDMIVMRQLPPGDSIQAHRGLPQGSPLSPLLLNVYLTRTLDLPWQQEHPDTPVLRYADDLLLLTRTPEQARSAAEHLRERLEPHGMLFRTELEPVDLNTGQVLEVWGYGLSLQDGRAHVTARLDNLALELADLGHLRQRGRLERHGPEAQVVCDVVRGWLDHAGPAYPGDGAPSSRDATIDGVLQLLRQAGLPDLLPADEISRMWGAAYVRWLRLSAGISVFLHVRACSSLFPVAPPTASTLKAWTSTVRRVIAAGREDGRPGDDPAAAREAPDRSRAAAAFSATVTQMLDDRTKELNR
jgi:hypothetical protein